MTVTEQRPLLEIHAELPDATGNSKRRGVDWNWVADQVRANAPNWCEVGDFHPSMATHIRNGKYIELDPDEFDVATRKSPKDDGYTGRKSRLFLRVRQ